MSRKLVSNGVAAVLCAGALATPAAAVGEEAPVTEAQAKRQLNQVEQLGGGADRTHPTIELRDLALALPALDGAAEDRARSILSRPPQGGSPYGGSWPSNAEERTVETPAFVVHYAKVPGCDSEPPNPDNNCDEPDLTKDEDGNDTPDYVDATVAAVNESIAVQNGELGWPLPKGDNAQGEPAGSLQEDRFDVYISDLCDESDFSPCVFGFAQPDDNSTECNSAPFECSAHLVLDNDYDEFGESGGELGLRVTTAHEYNHVLQFNLDANQDGWMLESTATWSEEKVFPDDDDWVRSYMSNWTSKSLVSMTRDRFRAYGSGVWNHWLENGDSGFGPEVILNAWQSSRDVTPKDYAVGAYDDAIKDEGGAGFPQQFAAFTAATAEWRTGDGGFPDAAELPDVTRRGELTAGGTGRGQQLDNTSYALFDVNPKNADQITLKGRSDGGVQWSIALVGRDGTGTAGVVDRRVSYSEGGTRTYVTLPEAQKFERITAVVTNSDGHVSGRKPIFGEFSYTRNNEDFKLRVR